MSQRTHNHTDNTASHKRGNIEATNAANRGAADNASTNDATRSTNMEDSPMMANLLQALKKGTDVGHYGRLTFVMVARHFMDEDEMVKLLAKQPDQDEASVRAMISQVQARDYNPPKRERILEWQSQQDFQICPDSDDPNACNVYSELQFPDGIYSNIEEYYEEQAHSSK